MTKANVDLLQGTLDLLPQNGSSGPMHGWGISQDSTDFTGRTGSSKAPVSAVHQLEQKLD
jgi:hypothetical protein